MAIEKITVPDFGDVQEITVLEVYVSVGDKVEEEDGLVALESEKAVMDLPSPLSGSITEIQVKEGDTVASGDVIALIEVAGEDDSADDAPPDEKNVKEAPETSNQDAEPKQERTGSADKKTEETAGDSQDAEETDGADGQDGKFHATPSVRAYAREHDIDLSSVKASGPKGRITREDVDQAASRSTTPPQKTVAGDAGSLPTTGQPLEDFSKYGEIEEEKLGRIKRISGPHLHRSWISIPHVTHFDEADVTDLENFRTQMNREAKEDSIKLSPLVFIVKALVAALKAYPLFNCSLSPEGDKVVLKKYYHIGIAVDTPNGLMVPVIKNADQKGMREIALELKRLSSDAREGKLAIPDIQGATFTISSLGGIGGTGFTPIISAPQVAILGLSRNYQKPVWDGEKFIPRLTLPFSVSFDHRVIDGAEAARFCRSLSDSIQDLRRALL